MIQVGLIGQLTLALSLPFLASIAHSDAPNESRYYSLIISSQALSAAILYCLKFPSSQRSRPRAA